MTIVFKVSPQTMERMKKFYRHKLREKTPPYAVFQAQEQDTIITLYESGKVMFQGISADVDASVWKSYEAKVSGKEVVDNITKDKQTQDTAKLKNTKYYDASTFGSDEVGTGDYFGPLVVTASYVSKSDISFLEELKVKDSKKLTDEQIKKIVPELIKRIPYESCIISPTEYNTYQEKGFNMNAIKAIAHNKVLSALQNKITQPYDYIVVDQFVYPKKYYEYLKHTTHIVKNITFMTKAEDQVLSVACSSIISRYIFIQEIDRLSTDLGITIPKGAGEHVDEVGKNIVAKFGSKKLQTIAKYNFKNTEKILNVK